MMSDALHAFQLVGDDTIGPVRIITIASKFPPFLAEGLRFTSGVFVREADVTSYSLHVPWDGDVDALQGHTTIVEVARGVVGFGYSPDLGRDLDYAITSALSQRSKP